MVLDRCTCAMHALLNVSSTFQVCTVKLMSIMLTTKSVPEISVAHPRAVSLEYVGVSDANSVVRMDPVSTVRVWMPSMSSVS